MRGSAELTSQNHWEGAWSTPPRWRLPSPLVVSTRNMQRILRPHVRPGARVLELGCAPGKMLAWAAASLSAQVSGLDYSERGITWTRKLLETLKIPADLRCENVFATTFSAGSFDVVYSFGLIEHFHDPRPIVRAHVALAKPGGSVVIGIPNYGGLYGWLQRRCDPENLAIHNLGIMNVDTLAAQAPVDLAERVHAYAAGRLSPWLISVDRRLPPALASAVLYVLNGAGLVQPFEVRSLCPLLVLEITRRGRPSC